MIVSIITAIAVAAPGQVTHQASGGRWVLQADPALCVLERRNIEPAVTLSIRTVPGSDAFRVAIVGRDTGKIQATVPASLTFSPARTPLTGLASVAALPDGQGVIWMEGVAPDVIDGLAGADEITIATKSGTTASARVTAAGKAVQALRGCNAEQLVEWGADAGQFAPGGQAPVATKSRDDWISTRDLMAIAGQSKLSKIDSGFLVTVSDAGVIDACRSLDSAIEQNIAKIACSAVSGKKLFSPAHDPEGKPVRGAATFRVVLEKRN